MWCPSLPQANEIFTSGKPPARSVTPTAKLFLNWLVHGLFVPNNNEVGTVDRVARERLDLEEVRREFKDALRVVVEFAQRDPIESAHNHVRAASKEAYFYAGLAFGLTFAEFRSRCLARRFEAIIARQML
jgi:hypothetical protein